MFSLVSSECLQFFTLSTFAFKTTMSGELKGNWGRLDPHPGPLHSAAQSQICFETQTIKQLAFKQFKFNRSKYPKLLSPGCPPPISVTPQGVPQP